MGGIHNKCFIAFLKVRKQLENPLKIIHHAFEVILRFVLDTVIFNGTQRIEYLWDDNWRKPKVNHFLRAIKAIANIKV